MGREGVRLTGGERRESEKEKEPEIERERGREREREKERERERKRERERERKQKKRAPRGDFSKAFRPDEHLGFSRFQGFCGSPR